jgi:hypothetical protein
MYGVGKYGKTTNSHGAPAKTFTFTVYNLTFPSDILVRFDHLFLIALIAGESYFITKLAVG